MDMDAYGRKKYRRIFFVVNSIFYVCILDLTEQVIQAPLYSIKRQCVACFYMDRTTG